MWKPSMTKDYLLHFSRSWTPGYPATVIRPDKALLYMDVVSYLAGNFRTVEEVKKACRKSRSGAPRNWPERIPSTWSCMTLRGRTLIVEWVKNGTGETVMNMYDGPDVDSRGGILTNDPTYPYQVENLASHANETPQNSFAGLPGGPSPADRFRPVDETQPV